MLNKAVRFLDIIVLIITAAACVIVAFLDAINIVIPDYSVLCFALLSAFAVHFISVFLSEAESRRMNSSISAKIDEVAEKIINSLGGVELRTFEKIEQVDIYIAQRIIDAKKSVCDLNWQDHLPVNPSPRNPVNRAASDKAIEKSISSFCRSRSEKSYREIFTFQNKNNISKMKSHIKLGMNYSCSYFESTSGSTFPKLQFVIIDDEEVIFASSAYKPHYCAISDKRLVSIMTNYFEQAWELSKKINERGIIIQNSMSRIEQLHN